MILTWWNFHKSKHESHAIVAKLDRSYFGGWLNKSYPCALFDPNYGQGNYANHTDMAHDIQALVESYSPWATVRAYRIRAYHMD